MNIKAHLMDMAAKPVLQTPGALEAPDPLDMAELNSIEKIFVSISYLLRHLSAPRTIAHIGPLLLPFLRVHSTGFERIILLHIDCRAFPD